MKIIFGLALGSLSICSLLLCSCSEPDKKSEVETPEANAPITASGSAQTAPPVEVDTSGMTAVSIKVSGMSCSACSNKLVSKLSKMDGIYVEKIDHITGLAKVKYDESKTNVNNISTAITNAGYSVVN